jgi:hypothetical protein
MVVTVLFFVSMPFIFFKFHLFCCCLWNERKKAGEEELFCTDGEKEKKGIM